MKITLSANYRLPSGKPMASMVADIFSLQSREIMNYVRSGRTTPINMNGWIGYTTDKLMPFYLYHLAQGWKTQRNRLERLLPHGKSILTGLLTKAEDDKKKDKRRRLEFLGLLAIMNPRIISDTRQRVGQIVESILATSARRVNNILATISNIEETGGQKIDKQEIEQAVRGIFENPHRIDTIGETESSRGYHFGAVEMLRQTRMRWMKTWITSADERVCPVCKPLHGVTIPIDQTFYSVPTSGPYSGLYNLVNAPPAHPGTCRCKLLFSTEIDQPISVRQPLIGA